MFYNPLIRSQSFSKPVCLGCDLYKCFSAFTSTASNEARRLQGPGVGYFPSPTSKARRALEFSIFLPKVS